jgi:predicted PurR-regulated permease PerM
MSPTRLLLFWITVLAAIIAVMILLREILLPFVAGLLLAYLLDPLASRLERLGMNRLLATLAIVALFIVAVTVLIMVSVPLLARELAHFIENSPRYLRQLQALADDPQRPWLRTIVADGMNHAERSISELAALAVGWLASFLQSAWSGGRALLTVFSLLVVTPVIACYLIYDWPRLLAVIDHWVPPVHRETVRALAREINDTIGGFVRGQSVLCLILGVAYALALTLIGLKHGMLIGLSAGLISFVPYLGLILGLLVSTCVAIAQFWPNWTLIAAVPAIFLIGQGVADYLLSPNLVGRRVNLNPVWLMFSLFAFGYLFGFIGLLIAVPLAAAIGVLLRFALAHYYASPLYAAAPPEATVGDCTPTKPNDVNTLG